MVNAIRFSLLTFIIGCLSFTSTKAQEIEFGAWGGVSSYFGDLNTKASFDDVMPGFGVLGRYNITNRFAYKGGLNFGIVAAHDKNSTYPYQLARNLSFQSNIFELTNQMEFNFFHYVKGSSRYSFTPYLLAGVSIFYFNPKTEFNGELIELQPLQTENVQYKRVTFAIPYGGGFKYSFTPQYTIGFEVGYRKTFTDYLDDVSDVYVQIKQSPGIPESHMAATLADRSGEVGEPIGVPGKQRGNVKSKDDFMFAGIFLTYTIRNTKCPTPSQIR